MTTHTEPLDSVLDTIGETPLVRVQAAPDEVPVYAKLESFNPGASIKDRIGKYMLAALEHPFGSEERRVGKECASMCRSRWSPYH